MSNDQLATQFEFKDATHNLPETSIFVDCDLYQVNPKVHSKESGKSYLVFFNLVLSRLFRYLTNL